MDWVLRSPQIHSTFSQLGYVQGDGYHVNENCNSALETILRNILEEDKYLRTYRRSISFGQNIQKDIIPLLIHAKDDKTVELIIKILVNLTIPIDCLLNVNLIATTDFGRHTIFEINNLLAVTKAAFADLRTSKALLEFLRKNVDVEQKAKLSEEQRTNASNALLLLRNILHIPEDKCHLNPSYNGPSHSIQNQILWNIFSQSVDKIIFKSMTICDAKYWGVTMVQIVAILYKDQHNATLQKLLYSWLEASLSESSGDNESNTSSPDRGSVDSSAMLTSSDLTSDSSDNGGDGCDKGASSSMITNIDWKLAPRNSPRLHRNSQAFQSRELDNTDYKKSAIMQHNELNTADDKLSRFGAINEDPTELQSETTPYVVALSDREDLNTNQKQVIFETSDCGYGTQIENQESISTSSNDDDLLMNKPVHKKPRNPKQRPNNKPRLCSTNQERKKKKILKRGKSNVIANVWGLSPKPPTDVDISNVLKKFTVDFLLKGYNSLVRTLHDEILTNQELQIDTSHFFWLITYFLKFATQIELDLELINDVLSFEIVSYLTSEGVNLCEQFELSIKLEGCDLTPYIRRQHLVVTAIREFVQAIEVYKRMPHLSEADQEKLKNLEIKMCETEDLRSMLVLLLRHYNPKYHTKQYLQDLIVTNHILLMFLDNVMKIPDYTCSIKMANHIEQFATPEVMATYGLLLEGYLVNGEFVNDCIFTLMHHVGGEGCSLVTLFQPNILKTFTAIWKSDFEICEDWSDLIEYVINTFVKKPDTLNTTHLFSGQDNLEYSKIFSQSIDDILDGKTNATIISPETETITALERWTEDEISSLNWSYLQCNAKTDVIGTIIKQLQEDSIEKTRESVIKELFRQNLISKEFYENQLKGECVGNERKLPLNKESPDKKISKLCEQLILDGKSTCLEWVQKVLLEICYTKLQIQKRMLEKSEHFESESKLLNYEILRVDDFPVVSPVVYHSLIKYESVPLVPWNCQQALVDKDLLFQQLLSELGFQMAADTGQLFVRIPYCWTADCLFGVAGKIRSIDTSQLKFTVSELSDSAKYKANLENTIPAFELNKDAPLVETTDNFHIHKQNLATMVNFIPRPGLSFKSESKIEPLNWLKVVKKSQQCKITLKSFTETNEDMVKQVPGVDRVSGMLPGLSTIPPGPSAMLVDSSAMLPGMSAMLPRPSAMLPGLSAIVPHPSAMLPGLSAMLPHPSAMLPGLPVMLPRPSAMLPHPSAMLPHPSAMLPGLPVMLPRPSAMLPHPSAMLPHPSAMLPGLSAMLPHPSAMLPHPSAMRPGSSAMLPYPPAMMSATPSRSPVVRRATRHVRHDAWHVQHDQQGRHAARSHPAGDAHRTMRDSDY